MYVWYVFPYMGYIVFQIIRLPWDMYAKYLKLSVRGAPTLARMGMYFQVLYGKACSYRWTLKIHVLQ